MANKSKLFSDSCVSFLNQFKRKTIVKKKTFQKIAFIKWIPAANKEKRHPKGHKINNQTFSKEDIISKQCPQGTFRDPELDPAPVPTPLLLIRNNPVTS